MSPAVTRRVIVGGVVAAATVGVPTLAEAGMSVSGTDAELSILLDRHAAARAGWDKAGEVSEAAMHRAVAAYPPRPDALRWRATDFPRTGLGRGLSDPEGSDGGRAYGVRAVAYLCDRPAETWFRTLQPPLEPECESRRLEILAAWDGYVEAIEAVNDAVGLTAAAEVEDAAGRALDAVYGAVEAYTPRTLAGLARKALWVAERLSGGGDAHLGEVFAREVASFGGGRA